MTTHLEDLIAADPLTGAWFSPGHPSVATHRYALWRVWDRSRPLMAAAGLNPSTADARRNDPTILRECHFSRREGFGGLVKVNAFGFRSSHPEEMRAAADPRGPENGSAWRMAAQLCPVTLMAYGAGGGDEALLMAREMEAARSKLVCLGLTKDGHPIHPLSRGRNRVPDDAPFQPFGSALCQSL